MGDGGEIRPLDAGHYAWEQAAEEYGRLVAESVSGGYRRVLRGLDEMARRLSVALSGSRLPVRVCDDDGMETPTTDSGSKQDFFVSGVVLMKGHPHHPALHHHGLGELSVSSGRVKLFSYHSEEELAECPAERVTLGTSSTLKEFGSILFVDFGDDSVPRHEAQWAIDFGLVNDVQRLLHPDGTVNHEKLVEYQVLLSVQSIDAGIGYRQQFMDAVTAGGGRYEDESTWFEHLIAKWQF
jgi:hypothetical protein